MTVVEFLRTTIRHGGFPFGRGALYHLLANPVYVGEIRHRSVTYPGQHEAIIERTARYERTARWP